MGAGSRFMTMRRFIIDTAFENDWVRASGEPQAATGFKIAIIGSGPAGLSAAWALESVRSSSDGL